MIWLAKAWLKLIRLEIRLSGDLVLADNVLGVPNATSRRLVSPASYCLIGHISF
jgi:hypothetical protein